MVQIINLLKNGEVKDIIIENNIKTSLKKLSGLDYYIDGLWSINKNQYFLYVSDLDKAGMENKHDLPPPHDNDLYFGDLYIIKKCDDTFVDISVQEYILLMGKLFKGFEDLDSDNSYTSSEEKSSDSENLPISSDEYSHSSISDSESENSSDYYKSDEEEIISINNF